MNMKTLTRHLGVSLITLTLFMFEISLTRLFSTLMWYHYVFVALSLAMLGSTVGGVQAFKWLKSLGGKTKQQTVGQLILRRKLQLLAGLAVSIMLNVLLLYKVPYQNSLVIAYIILSAIPFVLGSYYMALVFRESPQNSNSLYFADLIGAATGSLLIVVLLDNYSLIRIGLILAMLPLITCALNLPKRRWAVLGSGVVSVLLIAALLGGAVLDTWALDFAALKGKPKQMQALSGETKVVYTAWNSLARTDVIESDKSKDKVILIDGGAGSVMVNFDGNLDSIEYLKRNVGYMPFAYQPNSSALIIGPGGGKDMLYAHLAGVHDITAVEINPGSVAAARYFKDFNGNIYDIEGTKTYVADGRSFVNADQSKYDVIFLSKVMTQASETLGYALSENYIYTKEAYHSYLDSLNPGGTLAFILHGANDLGKATSTLLTALQERGISREEAAKHMVVINSDFEDGKTHGPGKLMYPLLMVRNTPFTQSEASTILQMARERQQSVIHVPGFLDSKQLFAVPIGIQSLNTVTDDYPFFYLHGKRPPPIIGFVFYALLVAGLVLLRPAIAAKDKKVRFFSKYFVLIGLAFMLIEIPLIQKLVLLFGHPTLTFSVVIAALLLSVGIGSLSSKIITKRLPLKAIGTLIFAYCGLLFLLLPRFISIFQGSDLTVKTVATFVLVFPLGSLMGQLFPTGLRLAEECGKAEHIPLLRGVNGWMSGIGAILSLIVAMYFGYNAVLLLGAIVYLLFAFHVRDANLPEAA